MTHPSPEPVPLLAGALRRSLRAGLTPARLRRDALAGIVVGIVALPLAMALAIAIGVPPQHGIYTAIVAGIAIALFGGSPVQVSGPTAAFVVILVPIVATHGLGGLCLATMMAGAILVAMGVARLGRMVTFIPYPVTTGFTAGIAVVIAILQVRDALGLDAPALPHDFLGKMTTLGSALSSVHWPAVAITALTLATLRVWPHVWPRVGRPLPAPLVAVSLAAVAAWALARLDPAWAVETVGSRFGGIPQGLPVPRWPWTLPGADGEPLRIDLDLVRALLPAAFTIAILGAIESLLSAVVADGMSGTRHDPDGELVGQGVGNIVAPCFGGFAATGAIARTATNVRSGGRTPIASIVHALFLVAAVLVAAPLLAHLPMAAMAAVLLVVAWNMSEARHFVRTVRIAPRSDTLVLLTCFGLTVVLDMVIAVAAGVVLASLLFIRRMTEVSSVRLVGESPAEPRLDLPPEVLVYEIAGPLFFGAAQKAMSTIDAGARSTLGTGVRLVLLDLRGVPAMDATGLVNLESASESLRRRGIRVMIGGARPQPLATLRRAGIDAIADFDDAVAAARAIVASPNPDADS